MEETMKSQSTNQDQTESQPKGLTWIEKVQELQMIPQRIRNICILAHVDHGKTTLADCLISSNNIISKKLAGTLRYLDSREDEQRRMITMKASSISIIHGHKENKKHKDDVPEEKQFLINLIDSPGHVDFAIEVSSSVLLSDGAIVIIDAVEGVCPQTCTVIKQAWQAKVKTCLVLNKIDRLIVEKWMDANEIYLFLQQIIENVNSFIAELIMGDLLQKEQTRLAEQPNMTEEERLMLVKQREEEQERLEQEFFYSPEKGNVAFASAFDNWAFTLTSWAPRIAKTFGMNPYVLKNFLWGKFYYISKEKKIVKKPPLKDSKEMFVSFVMQPLVQQYRKSFPEEVLGNTIEQRKCHQQVKLILNQWMPVEVALLGMVIQCLPSPDKSQINKVGALSSQFLTEEDTFREMKTSIVSCNKDGPLVVFVTKMQPIPSRLYDATVKGELKSESQQRLVAVARVYSGTIYQGQSVYVFGANHSEVNPDMTETSIEHLFLMMGSSFQLITQAGPGCIVGIGGLDDILLKTGTISSTTKCPNFSKVEGLSMGLVKVSIEPEELCNMSRLVDGLSQLNRADPSVDFKITSHGQNILSTCGEVHLEKCLEDLKQDYAPGVKFVVGEPIISFKETIINRSAHEKERKAEIEYEELNSESDEEEESKNDEAGLSMAQFLEKKAEEDRAKEELRKEQGTDMYIEKIVLNKVYRGDQKSLDKLGLKMNCAEDLTANQMCRIKVRAVGLDYQSVSKWLEQPKQQQNILSLLEVCENRIMLGDKFDQAKEFVVGFRQRLLEAKTDRLLIRLINDHLQAFGPFKNGSNLLINKYLAKERSLLGIFDSIDNYGAELTFENEAQQLLHEKRVKEQIERDRVIYEISEIMEAYESELFNGFLTGFNRATSSGPLCEEPMQGACFIIQNIELDHENIQSYTREQDTYGPFSGQLVSIIKDLCKKSFLNAQPRIVEGMYLCSLTATPENYGIVYGLINKCRGQVVKEEIQDGTSYFLLDLTLPLVTSFEFNHLIRKECQGIAFPQLVWNGYEINNEDPFFIAKTEDEIEEHGIDEIMSRNHAKAIIENVRKRKGLINYKKIVVSADKQRTLTKNK